MVEVDLHLHTTHSDGTLTPVEIVRLCAARGLRVISISDHDSTDGIAAALAAAGAFPVLTIIPGIELGTDVPGGEVHILGYFIDHEDPGFQQKLRDFRDGRQQRAFKMVEKLNRLGIKVAWERVVELSDGGAIGRPHIAQAMVEGGYIRYPRDAFAEFLGRNGRAYVERSKLTPADAVRMLVDNGALPVMAHPTYSQTKSDHGDVRDLRATLTQLKDAGLVGMEVYYGSYTGDQVRWLKGIADELGLIPCGGSDYHAAGNPGEAEPGSVGPPMETVEALRAIRRQRSRAAERP